MLFAFFCEADPAVTETQVRAMLDAHRGDEPVVSNEGMAVLCAPLQHKYGRAPGWPVRRAARRRQRAPTAPARSPSGTALRGVEARPLSTSFFGTGHFRQPPVHCTRPGFPADRARGRGR